MTREEMLGEAVVDIAERTELLDLLEGRRTRYRGS